MPQSLRHKTTALAQRALAIDALHRKVDLALGKLEGIESTIDARARRTEEELRKLEEHLKRFAGLFHERILISKDSINPPQKAVPERTRYNQVFAVVSWGCAATKWLAKALNSHPEILCLHAGNGAMARLQIPIDSVQYLTLLSNFGEGYIAVGDVHGLSTTEISKLKEAFGSRFNAVIVVREPIARLRSQMALYEHRGLEAQEFSYAETLIERKNIHAKSEESKMFVHAADMLNAVKEEISRGTIYKAEDLTTNPNILAALTAEITGGQIGMNQEWLETCVGLKKVNAHARGEAAALNDWQVDVVRRVVRPESWRIYEELGYVTPPFVDF